MFQRDSSDSILHMLPLPFKALFQPLGPCVAQSFCQMNILYWCIINVFFFFPYWVSAFFLWGIVDAFSTRGCARGCINAVGLIWWRYTNGEFTKDLWKKLCGFYDKESSLRDEDPSIIWCNFKKNANIWPSRLKWLDYFFYVSPPSPKKMTIQYYFIRLLWNKVWIQIISLPRKQPSVTVRKK